MPHINKKRPNTRLQIIQLAAKLFIEEGYSKTPLSKLAKILDLSPGNITFYFPTKDYLLAVLTDELCDFQAVMMEQEVNEGRSSLLAYCLELTSMAAICEENKVAKDFYTSIYTSEVTLDLVRKNDTEKTKAIFKDYCPDWTEEQWSAAESIVSGIEYATIMTTEQNTPLPLQIENALNAILMIYGVPEELRRAKIEKVLAMDYRALSRHILSDFKKYIEEINEKNLKNAIARQYNKD